MDSIPPRGTSAATVQALIENAHALDFDQRLNTSSYVNVSFEPEEEAVALFREPRRPALQSYKLMTSSDSGIVVDAETLYGSACWRGRGVNGEPNGTASFSESSLISHLDLLPGRLGEAL